MIRFAALLIAVTALVMITVTCDDYSHNAIVNTPPVNYVNLTMVNSYGGSGYDWGTALTITADNEYVITGSTTSNGYGLNTVYLAKIGPAGNELWYKWFGGWGDDNGEAVALSADSNIIVAGVSESFDLLTGKKIDPNSGQPIDDYNFYLVKTNMDGATLWEKVYGDTLYKEWGTSLATLPTGYLIAGYREQSQTDEDVYVVRTDLEGDVVWQMTHGTPQLDRALTITRTSDGGFVAGGYSEKVSPVIRDPYLLKMNDAGGVLWEKVLTDNAFDQSIFSLVETRDGGLVATGFSRPVSSTPSDNILYVFKTDANGQPLWEKTYSQSGINDGRCIIEDREGSLLVCGQHSVSNAIYIAKLDGDGNFMWSDSSGATGYGMSMIPSGSGYAIAGSTAYPDHRVINNVLLLKIEEDKKNVE